MTDTLRADLEAAMAAEETTAQEVKSTPNAAETAPTPEVKAETPVAPVKSEQAPEVRAEDKPAEPKTGENANAPAAEVKQEATAAPALPPPQAWKGPLKSKWSSLDPEIQAEVTRREREILREFGVSAIARKTANELTEIVRPYEARIRANGLQPLQAVNELFKADHLLSTAPPVQRAQYMARLIKQYGVDIQALDSALAGEAPDPAASRFEQILEQRLAPVQQFIQYQQQQQQAYQQQSQQAAVAEIQAMMDNPTKYPYFEDVREDMADLIDLAAKRGTVLSPGDAYDRAVRMNPETAAQLAAAQSATSQRQQAQVQSAQAQKALQASASVKGAPVGQPVNTQANSLRDTIEAAMAQINGR